jgi:hypothetical protein
MRARQDDHHDDRDGWFERVRDTASRWFQRDDDEPARESHRDRFMRRWESEHVHARTLPYGHQRSQDDRDDLHGHRLRPHDHSRYYNQQRTSEEHPPPYGGHQRSYEDERPPGHSEGHIRRERDFDDRYRFDESGRFDRDEDGRYLPGRREHVEHDDELRRETSRFSARQRRF